MVWTNILLEVIVLELGFLIYELFFDDDGDDGDDGNGFFGLRLSIKNFLY